jgi:uncharacterized membrane protein
MDVLTGASLFLSVAFFLIGYATIIVGRKKMINWVLGVRWTSTMKNPEIWKAVNVRTGWMMILHGVLMLSLAIVLPEIDLPLFSLCLFGPALTWAGYSLFYANQLKNRSITSM